MGGARRVAVIGRGVGITVDAVLHPVGSLPPTVYWKRRVLGIVVLVLVAVVPFLLLGSGNQSQAAGGGDAPPLTAATGTPQLGLVPATPLQKPTPTGTPSASSSPTPGTSATPSATTSQAASQTAAQTASPPVLPTSTSAASPSAPAACADEMLTLTAAPQAPEYSTADQPTLLLNVQNVGPTACERDLGGAQQEFVLSSGETRLWGSNDCYPSEGADVRLLQPGQAVQLPVLWSGLTSEPGCTGDRHRLDAGDYTVRARLGTAWSPDATLSLR